MTTLTGNTYPVRDQLKALGAIWNPVQRAWMVPANRLEEAEALVRYAPPADRVKRFSQRYLTTNHHETKR